MAQSFVDLSVRDNGFNAKIKGVINTFMSMSRAASSAKGQFSKFADSISQVAQSQELLNSALKGNPYGLLMQAATTAFTKIIEKATAATEAEKRAIEWAEKKAEAEQTANEAIGRSTGELLAKYELLRVQWNNLSTDQQKNEWIKKNQSAFNGLNLAVSNVNSAENVFVNNSSKVVAALKARAQAEAYADLYKEQIKKNATSKATGKYNSRMANANVRDTINEHKAGITNADINWTYRNAVDENGNSVQFPQFKSYKKSGLQKLQAIYNMGSASLENADRMKADYYASMMAQSQAEASSLSANGLFGITPNFTGGKGGSRSGSASGAKDDFQEMRELTGLIEIQEQKVRDLQQMIREAPEESMITTLRDQLKEAQDELDRLNGKVKETGSAVSSDMNPPLVQMESTLKKLNDDLENAETPEAYQNILSDIKAIKAEIASFTGENPVKKMDKEGKNVENSWQAAAGAISNVGQALGNIEDPGMKIMAMVAQAIASVAAGAGQAMAAKDTTASGWAWIGAAAAIASEMVAIISTIHSATGYAQGGVIGGNRYSGDQQWARVNAGETILTRAQAGLLVNQLEGVGLNSMTLEATVTGEDLRFALRNNGRRHGYGENVTSRNY